MKISVVSGGFDPIHSGHIAYLNEAKKISDFLIVALNSDKWLTLKKKKTFMPFNERRDILMNIKSVDEVVAFDDDKKGSCIDALNKIKQKYPNDMIIFCNGGDRDKKNIPEMNVSGIEFKFGIGGSNKKNSSSWILKNWNYGNETRVWGSFFNLFDSKEVKVKELIIMPNKGMSFQKHIKRNEIWLVSEGACEIIFSKNDPDKKSRKVLEKFDHFIVKKDEWHQITNPFEKDCHIIEIQYGNAVIETDIERLNFYNEKNL